MVNKYRVWCNTDGQYEYVWAEATPTLCPVNPAHTIDTAKTAIIESVGDNIVHVTKSPVFGEKTINGKKLYVRDHGASFALSAGTNDTLNFNIPYDEVKFNGIEIIGGEIGDKVDLKVWDTPTGTISTIANYVLNQFGYSVNVAKDYYHRESKYDADLIKDMKIEIEYNSVSAKTVYVNYLLHELKI